MLDDTDRLWLNAVRGGHPPGPFGHREHLRLAWLALEDRGELASAQREVSAAVRRIAEHHGAPQRYNQTVTDAWVRIVAHCRGASRLTSFEALLDAHPWLFDKRLLLRHYTSRTLAGDRARASYVEPDLRPIPG